MAIGEDDSLKSWVDLEDIVAVDDETFAYSIERTVVEGGQLVHQVVQLANYIFFFAVGKEYVGVVSIAFDENDLIGWNPDDFAVGCYFKPFHIFIDSLFCSYPCLLIKDRSNKLQAKIQVFF